MKIYQLKFLRKLLLPAFSRCNPGDISIKHHYTGTRFVLHSFKHKGYWYHGKNREKETMCLFSRFIKKGDTVIEIGGHIGYISVYFSELVGTVGRIYVFEPGINNLPYIQKNLEHCTNITLIPKAVGNCNGTLPFYLENLTGQNNSFIKDYSVFKANTSYAFSQDTYQEVVVEVVNLDDFLAENNIMPTFIKIDVEGFEINVLKGMLSCLRDQKPILMVEITENRKEIYELLIEHHYVIINARLQVIRDYQKISGNTFCLHRLAHLSQLMNIGVSF